MIIEISGHSRKVEANGLTHRVLDYGTAERGTVLLLPGITSPAPSADFIAVAISGLGFRVIVPDLRGRGQTDTPPSGHYRIEDYAADVAGIVEALGIENETVVGHSLGARIAAAYVVLHAPDTTRNLVLIDPPVSGPGRAPYPTSREQFLAQLHAAQRGTTAEEVKRFYPKWPERELQLRAEILASCNETAVVETHAAFESEDFFPFWKKLRRPGVLIRGAASPVVTDDAVADLAAANPVIPIVAVAGAGHMVPWDNFRGFFDILSSALIGGRKH